MITDFSVSLIFISLEDAKRLKSDGKSKNVTKIELIRLLSSNALLHFSGHYKDGGWDLFKDSFIPINLSLEEKIYFYRSIFHNYMKDQKAEKIYISRNDSKNRKIANEKKLIDFLQKQNFKIVQLSNYNFIKQNKWVFIIFLLCLILGLLTFFSSNLKYIFLAKIQIFR